MDAKNITYMTYANLDRDHSTGVELMTNLQITNWFRVNISGNYYYYKLEGDVESMEVDKASTNYDLRADMNFMITPKLRFQVNGFYRGPSVTAQGTFSEFYMVNSALRYDMFNHKVQVSFNARDIFNTMKHQMELYTPTFNNSLMFGRENPTFKITVSYRINNFKKERPKNMEGREGGGDDI
jgi:outer membrane receptor protein involved in Fe transport